MPDRLQPLQLPLTYEELVTVVGNNTARMIDLIVPLTKFEEQIVQILADMRNNGYLLFVHGVSGVGKSTFISSLAWRKHIPIKNIVSINAGRTPSGRSSANKMRGLFEEIRRLVEDFELNGSYEQAKPCIVIDYLESIKDEKPEEKIAFFRDLNGLLRQYPVLIVWPVTIKEEVDSMRDDARSFSTTIFHRRIPFMEFTGPEINDYSNIAKKTIMVLNPGRDYYDFQLNDDDFQEAYNRLNKLAPHARTIREYLQLIKDIWTERVNFVSQITKTIPGKTEVWFVFGYPGAEDVVASFAKKSQDVIDEAWNADYRTLSQYIRGQRSAEWTSNPDYNRLAVALSGALNVKIMYIPTNSLVSLIAAYNSDQNIEQLLRNTNIPDFWFTKSKARKMLESTPLYLQLNQQPPRIGKRRGGPTIRALEAASPAYNVLNQIASQSSGGSDKALNQAISLGLHDTFAKSGGYAFVAERNHPWLTNIIPDVLIEVKGSRDTICLEFHYTSNKAPNQIASYVLRKLNTYMNQIEDMYNSGRQLLI
jgi:hypothetical protein